MNSRRTFYLVLLLIAICGAGTAYLRHVETGIAFLPGKARSVWLVEARIDFNATGQPVTASLSLPNTSLPGFELVEEHAASPGYGFSILDEGNQRRALWTKRLAAGPQSLYYSAQFVKTESGDSDNPLPEVATYPVVWDEPEELAGSAVLDQAHAASSSPESLTRELIKQLNNTSGNQNTALLRSSHPEVAELLMILLSRAGIATNSVMALPLQDARRRQSLSPMVEVYSDGEWLLFNPATGAVGLPPDLLLWHRGGVSVLDLTGGYGSGVSFSMIQQTVSAQQLAVEHQQGGIFADLGVHQLPIEEQSMFKLLLLLPLGAAVVVFMRVIIGLKTSGTFMPILISLAFLQTSLLPGLVSFVSVVAIGLLLRGYLSRLSLLMVSRLATLIVLVIFIISIISVVGYQLGYSTGMTITFFPMIIIAWTIERMSILWEEEGPSEVFIQGGGSLLVAIVAYTLMQWSLMQHLSFNFPELNLVLLAIILALGQYTGFKLTELRRFRAMDELE